MNDRDTLRDHNPARRRFLAGIVSAAGGTSCFALALGLFATQARSLPAVAIRPPGAGPEADFLAACVRCGLCVRDCPYPTLSLATLPKGSQYSDAKTNHRYIRGTDILAGHIRTDDLKYISDDIQSQISRYVVDEGDVVITIAGKIGVCAPVTAELGGVNLTENAARLTPLRQGVFDAEYLCSFLNSSYAQRQIETLTGRMTIGKLALARIKTISILKPTLDSQLDFNRKLANVRAVLAQSELASLKSEEISQSFLSHAFAT